MRLGKIALLWSLVLATLLGCGEVKKSFTDLAGQEVQLKDYLTKPALVVFWTTECPFCRAEIPALKKIYQSYQGRNFILLAVDVGEAPEKVREFVRREGIEYTVLLDQAGTVAEQYHISGVPTALIVDKNGQQQLFDEPLEKIAAELPKFIP